MSKSSAFVTAKQFMVQQAPIKFNNTPTQLYNNLKQPQSQPQKQIINKFVEQYNPRINESSPSISAINHRVQVQKQKYQRCKTPPKPLTPQLPEVRSPLQNLRLLSRTVHTERTIKKIDKNELQAVYEDGECKMKAATQNQTVQWLKVQQDKQMFNAMRKQYVDASKNKPDLENLKSIEEFQLKQKEIELKRSLNSSITKSSLSQTFLEPQLENSSKSSRNRSRQEQKRLNQSFHIQLELQKVENQSNQSITSRRLSPGRESSRESTHLTPNCRLIKTEKQEPENYEQNLNLLLQMHELQDKKHVQFIEQVEMDLKRIEKHRICEQEAILKRQKSLDDKFQRENEERQREFDEQEKKILEQQLLEQQESQKIIGELKRKEEEMFRKKEVKIDFDDVED